MQGARVIASVGCCVLASGLVVVSLARSELGLDVGYLLGVGVGVDLCFVPAVGAVQALCPKNPALAGGVAASGIGVGTLVVPVVAQLMIDRLGWREAMQFIGILAACGGLAALPLRRPPQTEVVRDVARRDGAGTLAPEVQHRGHVVLLYLAQLMVGLVAFVPFAHLVPFAEAQG